MPVRLLVVDDEPDLQILIRQRFRRQISASEYEFFFAANGLEALAALRERPEIDIILTDINMPEMDGLTLLAELARLELTLKSIVISAYGDMENIRTAMNRGAFDFITKPIDFSDLGLTIEKTVRELGELRMGLQAREKLITVQQELEIAAHIQQSILPKTFPPFPNRTELEIFASMVPARQVGGDFYDFFFIDSQHLAFMVGDVAGKGVPAAILMAVTRSLLKATALSGDAPGTCLARVNHLLCQDNTSELFVTVFYGMLNTETGQVHYSNAGHNPPFYLKNGIAPLTLENQGGLVLGVEESAQYETAKLQLETGETLFLYTDGVTEAMNSARELFDETRLLERLHRSAHLPVETLVAKVTGDIGGFVRENETHDDITMLAVRFMGAVPI